MVYPSQPAPETDPDDTGVELAIIGSFEPRMTMRLVEELNRRNIIHKIEDSNHFSSTLYALKHSMNEAAEVLAVLKKEYRRVRI